MDKVPYIAITCDLWKNKKRRYFLAITGHFFDKDLNYRSLILSFKAFNERHFGNNIKTFIVKELAKLKIDNKCVAITTDNESCMIKGCDKLFDNLDCFRVSCFCHNLNLIIINTLKLWSKPIPLK